MLLALQKKEWHELRSVSGVTLHYINMTVAENRRVLLIAIGSEQDDISGIDATLDISINGIGIDAIVEKVATNK